MLGSCVQVIGIVRRFDRNKLAKELDLSSIQPLPVYFRNLPAMLLSLLK